MDPKNSMIFKAITNKEEAVKMINEAAILFFITAIVQIVFGYILQQDMWVDAVLFLVLAFGLKYWYSRIVSVLLLLLSLGGFVMSLLVKLTLIEGGGTNVIFSALVLWIAVKTCEATFKYQNKFVK